ncbi:ArsR/SmtB family transcription factor [Dethiosulfovibrio faecalis]|uniref:ArsR/SmtB family transcription factor n=1 Tax=Dethiosulfovibrio faecalis TaxID=2720018 RepID=UPI003B835F8C
MRNNLIGEVFMERPEDMARIFKVLSVETRVRIVKLLKKRSLCVNSIARELGISAAAVSQHLRILRNADVVIADKRGYFVHYGINRVTLEKWREIVEPLLNTSTITEDPFDSSRSCHIGYGRVFERRE